MSFREISFKSTSKTVQRFNAFTLVLTMTVLCFVFGCEKDRDPTRMRETSSGITVRPARKKVFVLGLDGLTWKLINPMVKEGKLPNMKKIKEKGSTGILKSEDPMWSPLIWTTMVTGVSGEKHGIDGFQFLPPGASNKVPPISSIRKTKAIWNVLSMDDRDFYMLNWWATYPVEEVSGLIASDHFPDDPEHDVYPPAKRKQLLDMVKPSLDERFRRFMARYEYFGSNPERFSGLPVVNLDFIRGHWMSDTRMMDITLGLLEENPLPDLSMLYLQGTDILAHYYFGYTYRKWQRPRWINNKKIAEELAKILPGYYRYVDSFLGNLMKKLPENGVLIIVSDHGFRYDDTGVLQVRMNDLLEKWGYLTRDENGNIEWSKTKAYELTPNPRGNRAHIFINRKGSPHRGEEGILSTVESEKLIDELKSRLSEITSEGKPVFEIETPGKEGGPDIIARAIRKNIRRRIKIDGKIRSPLALFRQLLWTGNHHPDGVIMVYGRGVKPGFRMAEHSIRDICKTLLFLQGFPVGKDMTGKAIKDCWSEKALRNAPVREIHSYGDRKGSDKGVASSPATRKKLEELRALGYIQ